MIKYFSILLKKMHRYDKKASNPFLSNYEYNPFKSIYEQTYVWTENSSKNNQNENDLTF